MSKEMDVLHEQLYPKTKADAARAAVQKQNQEREQADIQALLKIPEGRRFVWKLLGLSGMFRASMTGEAMTTAFNEGRRDIGLGILLEINTCDHNAFAQMQSEHFSKSNSEKTQIEKLKKDEEDNK